MLLISEKPHNLIIPKDKEGKVSRRLIGEIKRKAIHLLVLAIPIGFCTIPYKIALSLVILAEIIALIFDITRIQNRTFRLVIYRFFRDIFRHKERKSFSGAPYILFSSIFMMLVFNKWIAAVSLTYIIIGDPAAAIVGRIWGKHKILGNKSIEGSLSFFVAASLSGLIWSIVSPIQWHFAVIGGLFAALVEMIIYQVDDNLTVPILTALMLRFAMGP